MPPQDKNDSQSVWVVIPASGIGSRMKVDIPKQYLKIRGKTILEHTISRFASIAEVAGVLVLVSESDTEWLKIKDALSISYSATKLQIVSAFGGKERSDTVLSGLSFLLNKQQLKQNQWVMVHDAARPCVLTADIRKLLTSRSNIEYEGAILATPVRDTLKQANNANTSIHATHPRERLWQAQTPQLFRLGALLDALNAARQAGMLVTDEASAMEYSNSNVQLIEGSSDNIKLTTSSDLKIIDYLLGEFK